MITVARALVLWASLVAAAAAATRQPPPPDADQSPIVVTGDKASRNSVRDFVRDLTPLRSGGLGRFEDDVCPIVHGLAPQQNEAVAARIRLVARTAGIDVARPKCSPNVVLIVASGKKTVLTELRRRHIDYFGDVSGNRIRQLINSPEPVLAWQIDGRPMNADGRELPQNAGRYENHTTARASRLAITDRPQFMASVVVVEFDALEGLSIRQLADYVTLRALTGADPARLRGTVPPTILRAFDTPFGGDVPITLTEWDYAFLRGYYDARRNLNPVAQRGIITKSVADGVRQSQRD